MRLHIILRLTLLLSLVASLYGRAEILNDGTSTENLLKISNVNGTDGAVTSIATVDGQDHLLASQSSVGFPIPSLRSAWIHNQRVPSGGEYTVSADFQAVEANAERRGGVMGWLHVCDGIGIAFQVQADGFGEGFRVNVIDFNAINNETNETTVGLFDRDGNPATTTTAFAGLGDQFDPSQFVTLELAFAAPTDDHRAGLADATATITARAYQGADGQRQEVSDPIELLTNLPLPTPDSHRVGYFAYWASPFSAGGDIGFLDNLMVEGELQVAPENLPPVVTLKVSPESLVVEPDPFGTFNLEVDAIDLDGAVRQVEIINVSDEANPISLATFDEPPYAYEWPDLPAGIYTVLARAIDQCGAIGESAPSTLTVNRLPVVTLTSPVNGGQFETPAVVELAVVATDPDGTVESVVYLNGDEVIAQVEAPYAFNWTNVPAGTHQIRAKAIDNIGSEGFSEISTITVTSSNGEIPTLMVGLEGSELVISWAGAPGFALEASQDLSTWTAVAAESPHRVDISDKPMEYYRLRQGAP